MKLNVPYQAHSRGNSAENARGPESLLDKKTCCRCGEPMKLVRRFRNTGTRQVWYCPGCFLFRIVGVVEYTVPPAQLTRTYC